MGVEVPRPGIAVFHLTLVSASHLSGGSPLGATPVASGPRHWCQLANCSFVASPAEAAAPKITPRATNDDFTALPLLCMDKSHRSYSSHPSHSRRHHASRSLQLP